MARRKEENDEEDDEEERDMSAIEMGHQEHRTFNVDEPFCHTNANLCLQACEQSAKITDHYEPFIGNIPNLPAGCHGVNHKQLSKGMSMHLQNLVQVSKRNNPNKVKKQLDRDLCILNVKNIDVLVPEKTLAVNQHEVTLGKESQHSFVEIRNRSRNRSQSRNRRSLKERRSLKATTVKKDEANENAENEENEADAEKPEKHKKSEKSGKEITAKNTEKKKSDSLSHERERESLLEVEKLTVEKRKELQKLATNTYMKNISAFAPIKTSFNSDEGLVLTGQMMPMCKDYYHIFGMKI